MSDRVNLRVRQAAFSRRRSVGQSIAQSPCLENPRKWVQPWKYFDSGSLDWGCCEQAHKGFAGRVCPPAPRQVHDGPHQILALLRCSLPAFRGMWQAGSPHSARRRRGSGGGGRPPSRGGEARTGRSRGPRADSTSHPYRTGRHEGRWRSVTPRRGVFSHAPAHHSRRRVDRSPCGGRSAIRADRLF